MGAELADPRFDREIGKAMDFILRQNYDSALIMARDIQRKDPHGPAAPFLTATTLAARFYDRNDTSSIPEFQTVSDRVLSLTENRSEPIYQLYRGAVLGYQSVIVAKQGRWVSGALLGRKSSDQFRKLINEGVTSADALGMLGCYHYWTSSFSKRFWWLPFIKDRREQGITEILLAWNKARYMQFALKNSLLWIYYDDGQQQHALEVCDEVLKKYRGNRTFRFARICVLFKMQRYDEARLMATALLKEYAQIEEVPVNLLSVKAKLAQILYTQKGQRSEADRLFDEIDRQIGKSEYLKRRLEKELGYLKKARNG